MIYLDYAAATPLDASVLKKMLPCLKSHYGNPSSIYSIGREARNAIEQARLDIATILKCKPKEIIFTSSGTEANNWAVFGLAAGKNSSQNHIITTTIEHPSIIEPLAQLERKGFEVTHLPVDASGVISLIDLEKAIRPETIFTSIIYANNEIGTIQNLKAIAEILHKKGVLFHTDACQAAGALPIQPNELGVQLMTINAAKIYGPKGIGALYVKEKSPIAPLLFGGGQEFRLRAGTENVAAIVGFAQAFKIAETKKAKEAKRLTTLRDFFTCELLKIPGLKLNGHPTIRLPNNINIFVPQMDAESLLLRLDMEGICASAGSACTAGALEPSHVLTAIGLSKNQVKNSIRFTLGRQTTKSQLQKVLKVLAKITCSDK